MALSEITPRTSRSRQMTRTAQLEFVIGGYTVGGGTFDALIFGHYDGRRLMYAGRTRSGFTQRLREDLIKRFRSLETPDCPFANLPEAKSGRWGARLTAAKIDACRWLKPTLTGRFEYVEWTPENRKRSVKTVFKRRATRIILEETAERTVGQRWSRTAGSPNVPASVGCAQSWSGGRWWKRRCARGRHRWRLSRAHMG